MDALLMPCPNPRCRGVVAVTPWMSEPVRCPECHCTILVSHTTEGDDV